MLKTVGVPKEVKTAEQRVALIPEHVARLVSENITVWVESNAGVGAGYSDDDYRNVGAYIAKNAEELYKQANLIVKVKEPLKLDLEHLKAHHHLFCYLHLASDPSLVDKLKEIGLTATAFETVVREGKTPLLAPMSAIAGRLSIQLATHFLHAPQGGRGTLLGGITGMEAGHVMVVGGGIAGTEAAKLALGMGARVTMVDINKERLSELQQHLPALDVCTPDNLEEKLSEVDVFVGAVYVIGRKAPTILTKKQLNLLPKGSVVVDISIDQGGCVETSKPCTHTSPSYVEEGIIHSAITNLPAAAPRTASEALSTAIIEDVILLAQEQADHQLKEAINIQSGNLCIHL